MKRVIAMFMVALAIACVAAAQEQTRPPLQRGIHVEMAKANHAVPMPAADEKGATVVAVTSDGSVFLGAKPIDISALSDVNQATVYVKADARTPYQKILAVLDALQGRSVVLLTAPAAKAQSGAMVPPYGLKVAVGGK